MKSAFQYGGGFFAFPGDQVATLPRFLLYFGSARLLFDTRLIMLRIFCE